MNREKFIQIIKEKNIPKSSKLAYQRVGNVYFEWLKKKRKQDNQKSREEFHENVKRPSGTATLLHIFDVLEDRTLIKRYKTGSKNLTNVQRSQSYYKSMFEEVTNFLSEKHTKAFSDLMAQDFMMEHSASQFEKIRQKYSDKELKLFKSMLKNMDL